VIVIEPINLGDQTSRWIKLGNGLHKAAVLCGATSSLGLWIGDPWPKTAAGGLWYCLCGSLAATALVSHLVHTVSWQADPCSYYQTETDPLTLTRLLADANYCTGGCGANGHSSNSGIQAASVVVLVRKDLRGRRILQNSIAVVTIATLAYRIYKTWF
jgi:Mitochondrial morphogenesis regulator